MRSVFYLARRVLEIVSLHGDRDHVCLSSTQKHYAFLTKCFNWISQRLTDSQSGAIGKTLPRVPCITQLACIKRRSNGAFLPTCQTSKNMPYDLLRDSTKTQCPSQNLFDTNKTCCFIADTSNEIERGALSGLWLGLYAVAGQDDSRMADRRRVAAWPHRLRCACARRKAAWSIFESRVLRLIGP